MFAKTAVFFVAFVAFVHAAPVVNLRRSILESSATPDLRPLAPIILPDIRFELETAASKRDDISVNLDASLSDEIGFDFGADIAHLLSLLKRDSDDIQNSGPDPSGTQGVAYYPFGDLIAELDRLVTTVRGTKRETVNLDTIGSEILGGLKSHGLVEYVDHFSVRIQRLEDLLSGGVSRVQITAEAKNLLLEYHQVLAGLHVNKPAARDVVIDSRVLRQLQSFVVNTVNLLNALGKSDAVKTFLSEVDNLKAEARNGTLDVGDLLDAARDIIRSVL